MTKLSIIIPCFNEEKTIDQIIERVEAAYLPPNWQREIIIVDDFSSDETKVKINKYSQIHTIVLRTKNGGKGAALKSGLEIATGDFVLIQDADLEYDPSDYQRLVGALDEKNKIVFGSRLRKKNERYSFIYFYGSKFLTNVFNLFFGSNFTDITTCYKLFPRQAISRLLQWKEDGFVFDAVYLTYELFKFGNVVEVPINYFPRSREEGKKVNWRHGLKALLAMIEVRAGKYWQFFKFSIVGGVALVVNVFFLYFFTSILGIYYLASSICAFFIAVVVNFTFQKFWTFGTKKGRIYMEAPSFLALQILVNLFLNTLLLYIFVDYLHIWYATSQIIISLGLAVITFFINKRFIFKIAVPQNVI